MEIMHHCRFCSSPIEKTFINLGSTPLSNAYLSKADLEKKEITYPLHARICEQCFLVQLPQVEVPETIFKDYAYFSSYSDSWLAHAKRYVEKMVDRFHIDTKWQVIEVASNDGYLLNFFKEKNIPVLGIEPASNVAKVAIEKGIPTESVFFGQAVAKKMVAEGIYSDLLIANNVLAHVPNLNDFVSGLKTLLAPNGILTIEFPHLLHLIDQNQFDTIYHEHFSYFSLFSLLKVFTEHKLTLFDVEEIPTHGGSLRIFVKHNTDNTKEIANNVELVLKKEKEFGLTQLNCYENFSEKVIKLKHDLLQFLIEVKNSNKKIAGYGAPAKGNTLLNYFGISADLLPYTVDRSIHKQNKYLPGTHIPIYSPEMIEKEKPDFVLILPWNLQKEIVEQMALIREWGGRFVVPVPTLTIL